MTTPSFLLLLLSFLALVLNVSADDHHIQVPLGIPKTAALKYSRVLYQTEDERVTIYWEILDANASGNLTANIPQTFENEEDDDDDDDDDDHSTDTSAPSTTAVPGAQHWHAVLELVGAQDPVKTRAWVALGFGADTMLESQFIVCHQEQGSQISMNEHYSPEKYYPPPAANYPPLIKAVSGYYGNNTLACEFTRPLTHSDKNHIQINHLQPMSLLWSFNPASVRNYRGEWFFYHEPNHRGIVTTTLATGTIVPKAAKAIETKLFHGIGMLVVWLVLFPTAAFYARYRRSTPGWMLVHGTIQSVGVIAIFCFFGIILASHSKVDFTSTHGRLGISLLSLIVLQAIMGFLNFFAMRNESIARIKRVLKIYHTYAGDILIILAMVQAAYGIETVYPWAETKWRGRWLWIVYFILCLWWPIAFFCIELWYWRNIRKSQVRQVYAKTAVTDVVGVVEIKGDSKMDGLVKRKAVPKIVSDSPISTAGADGVQISLEGERLRPDVRAFTWELIGQEIAKGAMYVVANGRYVYDISKWISSHPGGQLILHAVNGTDITNDYFKPSGFDATEFVAKAGPPAQNPNRNKATLPRAAPAQVAGGLHPPTRPPVLSEIPDSAKPSNTPNLTEKEWKLVLKCRRTHVHTRLAIARLASLMVGELRPPPSSSSASDQPGAPALDPYEYRRYAMISKTLLTPGATKTPVYKFKFSLLYPFANSTGQQSPPYLPGQAVEIQARIDGQLVSRYYTAFEATPGSGDGVLECTIKIYPNSKMGNWLIRQREGDRQIKIRGPLGREILSTVPRWTPEGGNPTGRVIFFAGGTGILPFTQLLRAWVMLSSPTLGLVAASEYTPTLADELDIQPGDTIVPHHHYYDGWCVGTNLRTNATGAFPLSATYPPLTTPLVLVHSCSSPEDFATAGPEIEGAVLAWPGCIQVIRLTDDRVGKERVQQVVGNGEGVERIVVCGPQGFVDTVVESVEGLCGTTVGVEVLPHDRIVE